MVETLKAKCEEFLERVCNVLGGDVSCEKGKGCNIRGQTTAISSFGMEGEIFFCPLFPSLCSLGERSLVSKLKR